MTSRVLGQGSSRNLFRIKDLHSTISHFIGFSVSIALTPPLLVRASAMGASVQEVIYYGIYMMSLVLLYAASSSYHCFDISPKENAILKRLDHAMIFVLIAGTYTPVCMIGLNSTSGRILCYLVWCFAFAGIALKLFWVFCPKWVSSIIYISMGWSVIFQIKNIYFSLGTLGFSLLLIGGLLYTIGGLIYPLKIKGLPRGYGRDFGTHELFHIFILLGSLCHYLVMYITLTKL